MSHTLNTSLLWESFMLHNIHTAQKLYKLRKLVFFYLFSCSGKQLTAVFVSVCVVCISSLTVLKLWKRLKLWGGGGVSKGNCRKGFMSRWGWSTVGVRRKVGTAAPARLMPPRNKKKKTYKNIDIYSQHRCSYKKHKVVFFLFCLFTTLKKEIEQLTFLGTMQFHC